MTALIAHTLAVIRNRVFGGDLSPERAAVFAMYANVGKVLTGQIPAQVRDLDAAMDSALEVAGDMARVKLLSMMPDELRAEFEAIFFAADRDREYHELVQAAMQLAEYIGFLQEVSAGNPEFTRAAESLKHRIESTDRREVRYFVSTFIPSLSLSLDELG